MAFMITLQPGAGFTPPGRPEHRALDGSVHFEGIAGRLSRLSYNLPQPVVTRIRVRVRDEVYFLEFSDQALHGLDRSVDRLLFKEDEYWIVQALLHHRSTMRMTRYPLRALLKIEKEILAVLFQTPPSTKKEFLRIAPPRCYWKYVASLRDPEYEEVLTTYIRCGTREEDRLISVPRARHYEKRLPQSR